MGKPPGVGCWDVSGQVCKQPPPYEDKARQGSSVCSWHDNHLQGLLHRWLSLTLSSSLCICSRLTESAHPAGLEILLREPVPEDHLGNIAPEKLVWHQHD